MTDTEFEQWLLDGKLVKLLVSKAKICRGKHYGKKITIEIYESTNKNLYNLIKDINKKYGITVVLITHEMAVIQEICNRCVVLENGVLMEENTVEELFRHPTTNAAKRLIFNATNKIDTLTGNKIVRIAYEDTNTSEPIIANLILEFKTPVSILEANVSSIDGKNRGQMIIQLPDDEATSKKMIDYLNNSKTVVVEEVKDYVG